MMGAKIGDIRSQVEILGEILNFGNLVQLVIVVINIGLKMQGWQFYFASEIN